MRYSISTVEQATIDTLQADAWVATNVKHLDRYAGQLEDLTSEVPTATYPTPAMLILYSGSEFTEVANRAWDDLKKFSVIVIIKDVREGSTMRQAMNEALDELKRVLIDSNLGLDAGPITPLRIDPVLVRTGYCVYSFEFRLRDIT